MRQFSRTVAATLTVVALSTVPLVLSGASGAASSRPCRPADVTLMATPTRSLYGMGSPVRVVIALHNRSHIACTYVSGTFSPTFSLVNPAGAVVWATCWYNGGPAPCAYVLVRKVLAPGATYVDRLSWDQRSGHPDRTVAAGRYQFTVGFSGLRLTARAVITLSRP